jgi:hypothetical protein
MNRSAFNAILRIGESLVASRPGGGSCGGSAVSGHDRGLKRIQCKAAAIFCTKGAFSPVACSRQGSRRGIDNKRALRMRALVQNHVFLLARYGVGCSGGGPPGPRSRTISRLFSKKALREKRLVLRETPSQNRPYAKLRRMGAGGKPRGLIRFRGVAFTD